jgi:hypothetical protein
MDENSVLARVAESLRPGGTLAICLYSFKLKFPADESGQLAKYWLRTTTQIVERFFAAYKDSFPAGVRGLSAGMSGLDYVAVPSELYENVTRLQVNIEPGDKLPFYLCESDNESPEIAELRAMLRPSLINASERVEYLGDEAGWRQEKDLEWLEGFLASTQLPVEETLKGPDWQHFKRIVNSAGGKVAVEWPVAMLLASRRS